LSGRQRAELDGVIGYFANIGRIRTDLSGDPTFAQIVERARGSVLGLFEHQDIPFMQVREAVFPAFASGAGGHPLAALPVELQYFHAGQDGWAPGIGVVERPGPDKGPDELFFRGQLHPLSVSLLDDGSQLWGEINYKTDFYDEATIEGLARGLEQLVATVAVDSGDSAVHGGTRPSQRRLSELVAVASGRGLEGASAGREHRLVGTWRLD
ncbi:MAG: condensation domain-containing protein, partial [Actinomycetota bacterium]|nr:condensation domain-containing protein [Actinomycetota bacterium]